MVRKIKVYLESRSGLEIKDMSPEEAEKLLKETYNDSLGGLIYDKKTGEVISRINPDTEEILIINQVLGGG